MLELFVALAEMLFFTLAKSFQVEQADSDEPPKQTCVELLMVEKDLCALEGHEPFETVAQISLPSLMSGILLTFNV